MNINDVIDELFINKNIFRSFAYKYMARNVSTNCIISPLFAQIILGLMLFAGEGAAIEEIKRKFGYKPTHLKDIKELIVTILAACRDSRQSHQMLITNRIYVEEHFQIYRTFELDVCSDFRCNVNNVCFNDLPESASADLVKEQCQLDDTTKMILVTEPEMYLSWTANFTMEGNMNFHEANGHTVPVSFLRCRSHFGYSNNNPFNVELIEIKLKGRDMSMIIILPKHINGLSTVEEKIEEIFDFNRYRNTFIDLHLPIFRAESKINFKPLLVEFGVEKIFAGGNADLSTFCSNPDDLFLDELLQVIILRVRQDHISFDGYGLTHHDNLKDRVDYPVPPDSISPASVVVNHPFAFYVKVKDVILYVGRIIEHKIIPNP